MNLTPYFCVLMTGAAQKCFDGPAALGAAILYADHLAGFNIERETREVVQEDGRNVFAWVKVPVVITIEELKVGGGPYQSGPVRAKWVGGKRVF